MNFRYNPEKNAILLQTRGIGFEEIIEQINQGNLINISAHHNPSKYPNQKIMHVRILDKIYLVPYIIENNGSIFLITLYPSRKATKEHFE